MIKYLNDPLDMGTVLFKLFSYILFNIFVAYKRGSNYSVSFPFLSKERNDHRKVNGHSLDYRLMIYIYIHRLWHNVTIYPVTVAI